MTDENKKVDVKETADSIIRETKAKSNNSQGLDGYPGSE